MADEPDGGGKAPDAEIVLTTIINTAEETFDDCDELSAATGRSGVSIGGPIAACEAELQARGSAVDDLMQVYQSGITTSEKAALVDAGPIPLLYTSRAGIRAVRDSVLDKVDRALRDGPSPEHLRALITLWKGEAQ